MNKENSVVVPLFENIIIILVLIFALLANGLLIFLFLRDHRMHTTTNFFVMSHITSEFFASCQGLIISIYVLAMKGRVNFSLEACVFIGCENLFFFYASFLSLTAIAVNRYLAVVKKVHHKITANKTKLVICLLWLLSLLASSPWGSVFNRKPVDERRFLAWLVYCQDTPGLFDDVGQPASILGMFLAVVCTGIPILILLVCFYLILKSALRNRRQISVSYNIHHVSADAYARSAFTTLLIIAVYLICNAFILPLILWPSSADSKFASFVYRCIIWLRSATYPVVYILRNPFYFRLLRHKIFQISDYCCHSWICCFRDDRTSYKTPHSPTTRGINCGQAALEMQRIRVKQSSQCSSRDSPITATQQIRAWYLCKPKMAFTDLETVDCSLKIKSIVNEKNLKSLSVRN